MPVSLPWRRLSAFTKPALAVVAVAVGASGCGGGSGNAVGGAGSTGGTPHRGGTLVMAIAEDPANLNPLQTTASSTFEVSALWAEGLTTLGPDLKPRPALATAWKVADDGRTYTFTLRRGVTWQDGKPFTSADVAFTLTRMLAALPTASQFAPLIARVDTPDDHTAVVHLKKRYAPLLVGLSSSVVNILPKHVYAKGDPLKNPANLEPIGTGPFMLESWKHGQSLTFVRNPHYWDAGKPYLDKVVVTEIPDAQSRVNALTSGEVHDIPWAILPKTAIRQLQATNGVSVVPANNTPTQSLLLMNNTRGPLQSPAVRKAVLMGIDRGRVVNAAYSGYAQIAKNPMPPAFKAFYDKRVDFGKQYPFDARAAGEALDRAGFPLKDGKRFSLTMLYNDAQPEGGPIASVVRANLGALGIDVKLQTLDFQVWSQRVYQKHDYDLAYVNLSSYNDPALGVQRVYKCERDRTAMYTNASGYCNAELDRLFAQAQSAGDPQQRGKLYGQAEQIIAGALPTAAIAFPTDYQAFSAKIGGAEKQFDLGGQASPNWAEAWLP